MKINFRQKKNAKNGVIFFSTSILLIISCIFVLYPDLTILTYFKTLQKL